MRQTINVTHCDEGKTFVGPEGKWEVIPSGAHGKSP